ncbi:MAG: hypothetical protein AAGD25_07450 [Cyanobacteria bacterium P01_F01_bin.150]
MEEAIAPPFQTIIQNPTPFISLVIIEGNAIAHVKLEEERSRL